jgi:hypothetical protein
MDKKLFFIIAAILLLTALSAGKTKLEKMLKLK